MARPGLSGGQYQPLTPDEVRRVHAATLRVLEQTGVCVRHDVARDLYRRGGARLEGDLVYLTPEMVETALSTVPGSVLLAGRDPAQDMVLQGTRVYAGTGGSPALVLDPGEDRARPATLADIAEMAHLADALQHCDFVVVPLTPTDVPAGDIPVNRFYACLARTGKHVMGGVATVEGARRVRQLGALLAGGDEALRSRPVASAIASWMVSPLCLDPQVADVLIEWCGYGLPIVLSSAPMAGSTAPVTLAGTLVQLNAEQLSGIVLVQLLRPGTPLLAGYIPGLADMRSGGYVGGAVEFGMMQAAAAQLAHFYGVPVYGSGGMSDSKLPDAQAGCEKMATLLLAAMGGCNYIHHAIGMVSNMSATSLEQAVIDDEIAGMAMRVLRGFDTTEDALACEAIRRVGPGGQYLTDPHTLRFMRSELFFPALADRNSRAVWEAGDRSECRLRARAKAEALLREHRPPALAAQVDAQIRAAFDILL